MSEYHTKSKEELIEIIRTMERSLLIYDPLEKYYKTLDFRQRVWAENNWKSIQAALVEKMADMIENRDT